jgi:hypothetical protein
MKEKQLCFEHILYNLQVSQLCETCKNECKKYCFSNKVTIFCNKYKKLKGVIK